MMRAFGWALIMLFAVGAFSMARIG